MGQAQTPTYNPQQDFDTLFAHLFAGPLRGGATITGLAPLFGVQTPAFSATPALDPTLGMIVVPAAMTAGVNVANPVNSQKGHWMLMVWAQDGTGGRALAYTGSNWRSVGIAAQSTTLNTVTIDLGICVDGTIWRVVRLVTGQTV